MNTELSRLVPFFLETNPGRRFCIYHPHVGTCRGAVLYVHPFAEEMNKSRRMAALQARKLANIGFSVLQIDLYGCGDSSGDFRDARWEIWKNDLRLAADWLRTHVSMPVTLWGLRLGTLLALDFANETNAPIARIFLWQPVHSGEAYLAQFLRLRLANAMITGKAKTSLSDLKNALASTGTLEVAGYELAHDLVEAVSRLNLAKLGKSGIQHHWFETMPDANLSLSPAVSRILEAWENHDITVHTHKAQGEPFWSTQEITDCADLIDKTTRVFSEKC